MKYYIIYKENSLGGTSTVVKYLQNKLDAKIITQYESDLIFCKNSKIIVMQPKAILYCALNNLFKKKNLFFIFDTNPYSFKSNIKKITYYIISVLAYIFFKRERCIIPYGPLVRIWPYSRFTLCSWYNIVSNKFYNKVEKNKSLKSFIYHGTISKKKGYQKFLKFYDKNYDFLSFGYIEEKNLFRSFITYSGVDKFDVNLNNNLLVWTSSLESYGLLFREYIKSNGSVIFLRKFDPTDRVENAIYINSNSYKNLHNLVLNIANRFPQKLLIDEKIDLSNYVINAKI